MNEDKIKELSLLDDNQTKVLEWLEEHPEESEKLLETVRNVTEAIGEALSKVIDQLAPAIDAFASLAAAAVAEAQRIEEEGETEND